MYMFGDLGCMIICKHMETPAHANHKRQVQAASFTPYASESAEGHHRPKGWLKGTDLQWTICENVDEQFFRVGTPCYLRWGWIWIFYDF